MIEMDCPHCGHHLRIPDKYAGRKGGCVHCKGRFQLPEAPQSPQFDVTAQGGAPPFQQETIPGDVLPDDEFMPRSLSSLERMDIDAGAGLSPAFEKAEQESRARAVETAYGPEGLGCLFWGLAFHLPPVALVWALTLPKEHESKKRAIGVSGGFLLLAVLLIVLL